NGIISVFHPLHPIQNPVHGNDQRPRYKENEYEHQKHHNARHSPEQNTKLIQLPVIFLQQFRPFSLSHFFRLISSRRSRLIFLHDPHKSSLKKQSKNEQRHDHQNDQKHDQPAAQSPKSFHPLLSPPLSFTKASDFLHL